MTTQDAREELARVLATHLLYPTTGGTSTGSTWRCSCGATGLVNSTRDMADRAGRAHLADALLAAIPTPAQVVADAKAEAWDEGWDERDGDCSEPYSPHRRNPYRAALGGRDA